MRWRRVIPCCAAPSATTPPGSGARSCASSRVTKISPTIPPTCRCQPLSKAAPSLSSSSAPSPAAESPRESYDVAMFVDMAQRELIAAIDLLAAGDWRTAHDIVQKDDSTLGRSEEHTSELQSHSALVCR